MLEHDAAYKRLFSFPEMIADLLRGFVTDDWANELEFETLERVEGSYVADDWRSRESDIVWRVRLRGSWIYVYVLLEFQSSVDWLMALRLMVYVGLLYQDLVRSGAVSVEDGLPPVIPIVLYNGDAPWTAARNVRDLIISGPAGLNAYRPQLSYLLLDEQHCSDAEPQPMKNLVAALFRLENSRGPDELAAVIQALSELLAHPSKAELRKAFSDWLRRVLLPRRIPDTKLPQLDDLQEVQSMLKNRVQEWTAQWREEGVKLGQKALLTRLLTLKFGELPLEVRQRIDAAGQEQIELWSEKVLTADSLEEIFS